MDDKTLERLKELPVPEPGPGTKQHALNAALLAFDAAQAKKSKISQGTRFLDRLTGMFLQPTWSWIMQRRLIIGSVAASLLVVPIGAHLLLNENRQSLDRVGRWAFRDDARRQAPTGGEKPDAAVRPREKKEIGHIARRSTPVEESAARRKTVVVRKRSGERERRPTISIGPVSTDERSVDSMNHPSPIPQPAGPVVVKRAPIAGHPVVAEIRQAPRPSTSVRRIVVPPATGLTDARPRVQSESDRDRFAKFETNPVKLVARQPVSTFSIDVDTASYAFVRRMLERGVLPPRNAVRVEEMINYFSYDYPRPGKGEAPFKTSLAVYPTPWNPHTKLLHIGIKGHEIVPDRKPRSNLVFLIDVSGSMRSTDKLPLLKSAFRLLVNRLEADDTVSIVTYAGRAATVLEPTKARNKAEILRAIDALRSGGSTAGAQGIRQAYALAESGFDKEGVNRVILATDGDFNVGISDPEQLKRYIEGKRGSGIFLSVLGFGQGNLNDALMQTLAQNGNGNAAYIDSLREARKVLVEEAGSTLFPIAKDVKIQIEFNPAMVSEYRLIGYETRALRREDFNNDKVDAGDIGSGHTVTAIYEITPADAEKKYVDDLRYAKPKAAAVEAAGREYAFLKLRYKLPRETASKLVTIPVTSEVERSGVDGLTDDMRFAASVAAFGQKLRGESYVSDYGYDAILALARGARGEDPFGYRNEFLSLVRLARSLSN